MKGEIPRLKDLPKPWGPKDVVENLDPEHPYEGYRPVSYPSGFSPIHDAEPPVAATATSH